MKALIVMNDQVMHWTAAREEAQGYCHLWLASYSPERLSTRQYRMSLSYASCGAHLQASFMIFDTGYRDGKMAKLDLALTAGIAMECATVRYSFFSCHSAGGLWKKEIEHGGIIEGLDMVADIYA